MNSKKPHTKLEPIRAKNNPKIKTIGLPQKIGTYNGKDVYTENLTEDQRQFIIVCIGEGFLPSETAEAFDERYNLPLMNPGNIYHNLKRNSEWKEKIEKVKERFLLNAADIAGSHASVRIRRMEKVADKCYQKGDMSNVINATEQIRKEFDKNEVNQFNQYNQYNFMSDEEIYERKKYLLSKLNKEVVNGTGRIPSKEGS